MKYLSLLLGLILILGLAGHVDAQSKIIKKTVKKVVKPQIAPVQPPTVVPTEEVVPEPPPPPTPPTEEVKTLEEDKGLFGWGVNSELGGKLLFGSILAGVRGDLVFADGLNIGEKIGLAEDAVEYKLGLGLVISERLKSVPLYADAIIYLKEGSLFGMDPYIGTGLMFNLYGTGKVTGGLGAQASLGILADFGFEQRTGISVGYGSYKVGNNLTDSGIFINISQPIKL